MFISKFYLFYYLEKLLFVIMRLSQDHQESTPVDCQYFNKVIKQLSRTFGDIEAKFPKYGGNPGCVIVTPEIAQFKITDDIDYIMLACN